MRRRNPNRIISAMNRPATSPRVLLVRDRAGSTAAPRPVPIRRYRLARLRLDSRATNPGSRFEHLKRSFD
jgi:hypothetical protein